ncbi:hypothetical protein [Yinghuangia seranimata]|uniref:hypothetical protein n=1 Tax=Yinghuangia seranimata TaxID=408067 RepID=UPI00248B17A7|nr:hypothetical protein [Yinghuangia seranimata]MDI2131324.1 hypothetical protein [Yinghuangia seranimata]
MISRTFLDRETGANVGVAKHAAAGFRSLAGADTAASRSLWNRLDGISVFVDVDRRRPRRAAAGVQ